MLVIGLTGSIGSGKTTVANLFAGHGIPVFDADVIAREVTEPNTPAYQRIVDHFGSRVVNSDGRLNRGSLREIIFSNTEDRLWLENLLHPPILQRMQEQIQQSKAPYCIAVIPLLLETGSADFIQRILVVDVPEETQLERASLRDKSTQEQIKSIINTQVPRQVRLDRADDVIHNAGTVAELAKQVDKLHQMYIKLSQN